MPIELRRAFSTCGRIAEPHRPILQIEQEFPRALVLASGWACRERWLPNGRRVIFDLYIAGDVIGLDRLIVDSPTDEVVALTTCSYHALRWGRLGDALRCEPELATYLLRHLAEKKQELERQCTRLARLEANTRTTVFLAQLCSRIHSRIRAGSIRCDSRLLHIPLTQRHLADHLGLNAIHVNRTLRSLRIAGLIRTHSVGFSITDIARLKDLGDEFLAVA
jgi:CRP-like cAMP-binding protein